MSDEEIAALQQEAALWRAVALTVRDETVVILERICRDVARLERLNHRITQTAERMVPLLPCAELSAPRRSALAPPGTTGTDPHLEE